MTEGILPVTIDENELSKWCCDLETSASSAVVVEPLPVDEVEWIADLKAFDLPDSLLSVETEPVTATELRDLHRPTCDVRP